MTTDRRVVTTGDGPVRVITLNRPEARNALTAEMLCRFADAVADLVADDSIRVAIVTATGDAAFCAGGDLGTTIPLLLGERAPADPWEQRLLDLGRRAGGKRCEHRGRREWRRL